MIKPMLCERRPEPFSDPRYIWEVKYDGIRIVAGVQDGFSLQARSGTDKTNLFPELNLETKVSAVLDGELVCYKEGKLVFNGIQHRANRINNVTQASLQYPATYEVFDILMADGQDLQRLSLEQRKKILDAVLIPTNNVRVAPYTDGDGNMLFQAVLDKHMEGVVGKLKAGTYRQGKREWIKVKAIQSDEFVICGYTEGTGWRASTFGALVLGKLNGTGLTYVGSVGTGFDETEISRLYQRMLALGGSCPFSREPEKASWIKPVISVLVQYLEITQDGKLRFPSYKGMTN